MATVSVKQLDEITFEVAVQAKTPTMHIVTVQPDYASRLTGNKIQIDMLVSRSFDFLLEREPNTSILRRFDLTVIARYFPDYETTMRSMLV